MDKHQIIQAVRVARDRPPYSQAAAFAALRQAEIGLPVLVHTPAGEPAYWLVPFVLGGLVCGFSQVSLPGEVTRIGILGGSADDRAAWIPVGYFDQPPAELLAQVQQHYAGAELSAPLFSYDRSPLRWVWRLTGQPEEDAPLEVFISPGGWVARRQDEGHPDYE